MCKTSRRSFKFLIFLLIMFLPVIGKAQQKKMAFEYQKSDSTLYIWCDKTMAIIRCDNGFKFFYKESDKKIALYVDDKKKLVIKNK